MGNSVKVDKVVIDSNGAQTVLKSPAVAKQLEAMGRAIKDAANGQAPEHGYEKHEPFAMASGRTDRAFVNVYTRTNLGKAMQAKHDALTKAMDAGRL